MFTHPTTQYLIEGAQSMFTHPTTQYLIDGGSINVYSPYYPVSHRGRLLLLRPCLRVTAEGDPKLS